MNIIVKILQVLLAVHAFSGAVWKISNWNQVVPTLLVIPHEGWLVICAIEAVLAVLLILPLFKKQSQKLGTYGAVGIVIEMLTFTAIHIASGSKDTGPIVYWLVVAAIAGFVAYNRSITHSKKI